jgi:hypothetical protein
MNMTQLKETLSRGLLPPPRKLSFTPTLGLLFLPLIAPSLHAQFAVVDVDAIAGIAHQVQQGAQQIQTLQQQYDQMKAMAQQAQGLFRYKGPSNVFQAIAYADQYATLADWAAGGASGDLSTVRAGYTQNTVLANIDQSLSSINQGVANSRRALYATQEVMDGNNLAAMQTVGQIRAASASYKNAIDQMEGDSEDPDPDVQSALAVAQRTANATVLGLRAQQDTNNLLSQLASNNVAQTKLSRDTIADSSNRALDNQQATQENQKLTTDYTTSLQNWSIHQ